MTGDIDYVSRTERVPPPVEEESGTPRAERARRPRPVDAPGEDRWEGRGEEGQGEARPDEEQTEEDEENSEGEFDRRA